MIRGRTVDPGAKLPIIAALIPQHRISFFSYCLSSPAKMSETITQTVTLSSPPEITADNVATLFPEVDTSLAREILPTAQTNSAREAGELEGYDEEQVRLMDEVCIVLDNNDRPIGSASKKLCKLNPQSQPRSPNGGVVAGGQIISRQDANRNI
jgi:hypothetical protein